MYKARAFLFVCAGAFLLTLPAASEVVVVPFGDCGWALTVTDAKGTRTTQPVCAPLRGPLCPGPNGTAITVDGTTGAVQVGLSRHIYNAGTETIYAHYTLYGMYAVSIRGSGGTLDNSCPGDPVLSRNMAEGYWPLAPGDNVVGGGETMLPLHPLFGLLGGYLDIQFTTDLPLPVPVRGRSWGELKVVYR